MKFGSKKLKDARGDILAHSLLSGTRRISKGKLITVSDIEILQQAGITEMKVASLDEGDVHENLAAQQIGKVIPFAVAGSSLRESVDCIDQPATTVRPFKPLSVDLILTYTEGFKKSLLLKGQQAVVDRASSIGLVVRSIKTIPHSSSHLSNVLMESSAQLTLVLGVSATSDRKDVIPLSIEKARGTVVRLGMPADPGNPLVLGRNLNGGHIIGLPGCVRAPALNGTDWVLERLAVGQSVNHEDIANMGIGGLLKEIPQRIHPRSKSFEQKQIYGLLLAAGSSSRMGSCDKLLLEIDGVSLLRRSALTMLGSNVSKVFVAIKANSRPHREALSELPVIFVEVADAALGMSSSIRAGISNLPTDAAAVILGLADMPDVSASNYNQLIEAYNPTTNRLIIQPTTPDGTTGHPVLFDARFFENLKSLTGDQGARQLLLEIPELIHIVTTPDDNVVIDLDTPEAWRKWQKSR